MATHSSTLAWKIPWTEERSRLQSMGSQGAGRGTCSQNTSNPLLPPRGQLEMAHFQVSCSKEAGATTEYL